MCVGFELTIYRSRKRSVTSISGCPLLSYSICVHLTYHISYKFCRFDVNLNSKDSDVCISVSAIIHFFLSVFCKIASLLWKIK